MTFKRSFTPDPSPSDRRSGLNRRWIKAPYDGVDRRSRQDRRGEAAFEELVAADSDPARDESLEALLVSTSMMSCPVSTASPSLTRRLMTVASAMDSPSCGMMMGMLGMAGRAREMGIGSRVVHARRTFRAAAAMLRVVGRWAAQRFGW